MRDTRSKIDTAIIVCLAGFAAAFVNWLGSRTYPPDMEKVTGASMTAPGL